MWIIITIHPTIPFSFTIIIIILTTIFILIFVILTTIITITILTTIFSLCFILTTIISITNVITTHKIICWIVSLHVINKTITILHKGLTNKQTMHTTLVFYHLHDLILYGRTSTCLKLFLSYLLAQTFNQNKNTTHNLNLVSLWPHKCVFQTNMS